MPSCRLFVLGFLSLTTALAAAPGSSVLTVGALHDDNTSRSTRAEKADEAATAAVNLSALRVLNRDWQGNIGLTADGTHWREWNGLDTTALTARAGLRRKFGLGAYAPRLDLTLAGGRTFARTEPRSGNTLDAELAFAQRLSPVFSWGAAATLDRHDARRAVYSVTGHTLSTQVNWDPTPEWRLTAAVRRRTGDSVAWGRASWPEFAGWTPWLDGIFGGDWFPYRVDHPTVGATLSVSRALGRHSSLELNADLSKTGESGHVYRVQILSLHLVHAF